MDSINTEEIFAEFEKQQENDINNTSEKDELIEKCPSCNGSSDDFIAQSSEGAQICSNCGTHISDTLISMKQEWTNGAENGIERCSTTTDPLLVNQSKSTWISGLPYSMIKNHMFHNFYAHKEQGLHDMYKTIDKIGERNNIPQAVRDHAKKYCKMISSQNIKRGKSRIGMIGATIGQAYKQRMKIYLSEDKLAKICGVEKKYIQSGVDKLAEFNFIQGIDPHEFLTPRSIGNYAEEYMMNLEINEIMIPKVSALIERVNPLLPQINNMPSSIAGSCIYYVFVEELKKQCEDERKRGGGDDDEVSFDESKTVEFKKLMKKHCGLNEITINNCYNNILRVLN